MIFECRTFGPNGKLKYVKSPEECATHFYRDIEGISLEKLKPKSRDKKWSKEINCVICGDKVTVLSKRGIKCKKKACKEGLRKLREKQKKT
jgi:hypothetical protein